LISVSKNIADWEQSIKEEKNFIGLKCIQEEEEKKKKISVTSIGKANCRLAIFSHIQRYSLLYRMELMKHFRKSGVERIFEDLGV
jgi:fructose-1,6-bisphosphatase